MNSQNEENVIEQAENFKYQWTDQITKLLIEEVRNHLMLLSNKNYMQKKVWKRIANKINEKGYYITDEQCCVKWKNLKQKYKNIRDRNNQTGRDRQSWKYFDMIDDFITSKPEVTPVSIASSTHGFRIRQSSPPEGEIEESTNENSAAANSFNIERNIKKRRRSEPTWIKVLCDQREAHHEENMQIKKKFLTLFEKHLEKK